MEMLSLKQVFVRYVSHEIRSPLNVVHAGLDIVRDELRHIVSASKLKETTISNIDKTNGLLDLVEDIFAASDSAINILNDLLDYEHMDAGTFKLDLSWKPLLRLLDGKLAWMELLAKNKEVRLTVQDNTVASGEGVLNLLQKTDQQRSISSGEPLSIMEVGGSTINDELALLDNRIMNLPFANAVLKLDVFKIDQVIRNLVTNAMKNSTGGTVDVRISCKSARHDDDIQVIMPLVPSNDVIGFLRVEVIDSGAGIALEDQPRVFGQFTQFSRNELQGGGGSGLGLWISRRIITSHQGTMGFTSNGKGCGCNFFFELPFTSNGKGCGCNFFFELPLFAHREGDLTTDGLGDTISKTGSRKLFSHTASHLNQNTNSFMPLELFGDKFDSVHDSVHSNKSLGNNNEMLANIVLQNGGGSFLRKSILGISFSSRVYPEDSAKHSSPPGSPCMRTQKPLKPLNILIADDSFLNRKIVRRILESDSDCICVANIFEADDGLSAIEVVKTQQILGIQFDCVLIDFIMIAMNGPQAAFVLRNELNFSGPIIGITGNALPSDISNFVVNGASEVITKPLTKAKLIDAISRYFPRC
eukprot:CAMPEP_0170095072 /NCGR_PEP_ID=MMETSP0019_2-20121128/27684_1 /TAXON_ID=98059 /ORGANISM="Dinobryon sp., Strain UTEXLB2267" /LENGTH=585 /DNA_ID=CAMNT_0010316625 /DNA_START=846 /DNA_END=2604 /DNA_ORIENTATION=+